MPEKQDRWWQIEPKTNITLLGNEIIDIISKYVIPAIESYINDKDLFNLFKIALSTITKEERFRHLSIFFKIYDIVALPQFIIDTIEVNELPLDIIREQVTELGLNWDNFIS